MGKFFGKKIKFVPVDEMTQEQRNGEIERLTQRLNELYPTTDINELATLRKSIHIMQACKTEH